MKPADRSDYLATVPTSARGIIARAFSGKASAAQAVKAKCLDCCCYDRDEVTHCTVGLCPLHAYRPYRPPGEGRPKRRAGTTQMVPSDEGSPTPRGAA